MEEQHSKPMELTEEAIRAAIQHLKQRDFPDDEEDFFRGNLPSKLPDRFKIDT